MKCIVIDYDTPSLKELCNAIASNDGFELVSFFRTTTRAQRYLQTHTDIDIIFVDLNMSVLTGLQLVKTLVNPPTIVFTTNDTKLNVADIKVNYADILYKPYDTKKIKKTFAKVREYEQLQRENALTNKLYVNNGKYMFVKSEYKTFRINFDNINYIESMREYIRFHLDDGSTIMSLLSIKRVGNYLPPNMFMRVHRSYIVNLDKIACIERNRIIFNPDQAVTISDQYKDSFQEFIDRYSAI